MSLDNIASFDATLLGGKALNLGKLKNAGLPVPDGMCITTKVFDSYIQTGHFPSGLISTLELFKQKMGGLVAVRSSANCEDGDKLSMAGVFQSYYLKENDSIEDAIEKIYSHAVSSEVVKIANLHGLKGSDIKMGIIIQKLINSQKAGVIYTCLNGKDLLIQYVDGLGSKLVDGETHGSALVVGSDGEIKSSTGFETRPLSPIVIRKITDTVVKIESLYPGLPQDIEFALENDHLHVLQTRNLTTELGKVEIGETPEECLERTQYKIRSIFKREKNELGTENVIFSDSNFSELLPKPTEMDFGVFAYIFTGSNDIPGAIQMGRKEMGYPLGNESVGFMEYIGGKPYFSISRDAATFYAGFPENINEYFSTFVKEYLDVIQKDPSRGAYPEMGLYIQDPTFRDLETRFGFKAKKYFKVYKNFITNMRKSADNFLNNFEVAEADKMLNFVKRMENIDLGRLTNEELVGHCFSILEHMRTKSCVNFVKSARLGFYYSQRLQNLLKEKLKLRDEEVENVFGRLSQGLDGSAITDVNVAIVEAKTEKEAVYIAKSQVGHFSTGEMLEIRHKRLKDDPNELLAYVRRVRESGGYKSEFEKQKRERVVTQQIILSSLSDVDRKELSRVMQSSQTYMALRETVKYLFTKEYSLLRDSLEILEDRLNLEEGDIYYVYPRELSTLMNSPKSITHLIKSRRQSFLNYEKLNLPHVIRESDTEGLSLLKNDNEDFIEIYGKFLAEGPQIEGCIVNLDQFENLGQAAEVIRNYRNKKIPIILVAKQMNLGHDPFIALSSGLVLENAGIVSHGAQRARELGKGAIGGIVSARLKNGTKVLFDPINRLIRKI